jgi:ParB family transcriptional regulator, chromosome partitioning protein
MELIMQIITLDPRECTRWKYADRSPFEFGDTNALAEDITANGQISPIFVRPLVGNPKFNYEVIAGSRRLQACLNANIMINAIVADVPDDKAATIQIKENEQIPLSEFSKGIAFAKLKEANTLTQEQLAEIIGCSRKKVHSLLSFAKVDNKVWQAVGNMSKVSAKSAEVILALSKKSNAHKEILIEIAEEIRKGAGHRRITKMVEGMLSGQSKGAEEELIESLSGQILAKWKDGKLYFAKDLKLDKKKFNQMLIDFFNLEN